MRLFGIVAATLACSSVASAASRADGVAAVPAVADGLLFARQDNSNSDNTNNGNSNNGDNSNNGSSDQSSSPPDSQITPPPSSDGNSNSDNNNNSSDSSTSGDDKQTTDKPTTTKGSSTKTSLQPIDPQDPVGGLSMITPAATAASQYYKLGQTVTWAWNYTSLLRPPAHIDILASYGGAVGGAVPSPFTLAVNETFDPTQTFKWDTAKYTSENGPMPMGTYTLVVYDADAAGGVSHTPSPGYLGVWQQFRFGVYTGQPRTDLANPYICTTCNSAASLERLTVGALVTTAAMTVSSFMWFTGAWRIN